MNKPRKIFKPYYEAEVFDEKSLFRGVYVRGDFPTDSIQELIDWLYKAKDYLNEQPTKSDDGGPV